jgi:tuftelin-interacting protein 11
MEGERERPSFLKRRGDFNNGEPNKKPKKNVAAALMAKMGYKGTGGLGKTGQGIAEPVTVKMRQAGVGLGAGGEELSAQEKRERRRQAKLRGEVDGSSDEERSQKTRREKINKAGSGSGTSTPSRSKQKFSLKDIPEGMHVPQAMYSMIQNETGQGQKLLNSASISLGTFTPAETASTKLARRGLEDLNAYASAFNDAKDQEKMLGYQEETLEKELAQIEADIRRESMIVTAALDLRNAQSLDDVLEKLEHLQDTDVTIDTSLVVAAVHPFFKDVMSTSDLLEDNLEVVAAQLSQIISLTASPPDRTGRDDFEKVQRHSTKPEETMFLTFLLPKMRSAILNVNWDLASSSLIAVFATWFPLLPNFSKSSLLNQVVTRLSSVVHDFSPRKAIKKKTTSHLPTLLIPWLEFFSTQHSNPSNLPSLISEITRKFRSLLANWDLSRGVIPGLDQWRKMIGPEVDKALVTHLLPKLADTLSDFVRDSPTPSPSLKYQLTLSLKEINPAEQDLTKLEEVLAWKDVIAQKWLAELIARKVMPQLVLILHTWITSGAADYTEIGEWFQYWKGLTSDFNDYPAVAAQYESALGLINEALDLGTDAQDKLPLPQANFDDSAPESPLPAAGPTKEPPSARKEVEETTFRDVVEAWCNDEDLLMMPLRKAHDTTGSPLFRITASAAGQGGVQVYLKGDVLYAQNKKDKSLWEPIGLENSLVLRAEGK